MKKKCIKVAGRWQCSLLCKLSDGLALSGDDAQARREEKWEVPCQLQGLSFLWVRNPKGL